jgi:sterol desaturase/sphingolipid hydroxylase (fatty acid hydroxylase superfamily)
LEILQIVLAALLLLLLGDFVATFVYHVPEHVFGRYHSLVHHSPNRSFIRYALRKRQPIALIPGFCSALPYLIFVPALWLISPIGILLGLVLAELHVIWRHQFAETYRTPPVIQTLCQWLWITTPERHQLHHQNGNLAFGDIFTFYGEPAERWLRYLRQFKQQYL